MFKMKCISILTMALLITILDAKQLPPYLKICKRFDPEISKCWKNTFEELLPYLAKGIPEFKIPPLNPFNIDTLQLNQGNSENIHFTAHLSNVTFSEANDFNVVSADVNYTTMVIKLTLFFPHLIMNGDYTAKGRVLLFQFDSKGRVEGDFKGMLINGTYMLETVKKGGQEYLHIKESTHNVDIKNIYIYMHDLFRNNPEITANVNKAINENVDVLYEDFRPLLRETFSTIINEYTNRAYSQYPFDQLLPIN
ncbi:circadian clock-controlled protein daywake-like [Onthophagus taurus]|uniref:circadian clock-controlled protein daywake-like n=1 Tax=Onthophagus taurus TaxID=166361 RepID=UPI0039BDDF8A